MTDKELDNSLRIQARLISIIEDIPNPAKGEWNEYTGKLLLSEDDANALFEVHARASNFLTKPDIQKKG